MAKKPVDLELIRALAELLHETDLTEIEIGEDENKIRIARSYAAAAPIMAPAAAPPPSAPEAAPAPAETSSPAPKEGAIPSPMVGTAYLSAEPGSPAFVRVGDKVSEGDTLLIVEAMKVMNPITAPRAGTVTEILVENEQPVEYGQPLVVLS
ncbi:MAG: acetyl-CoA carboxylase biotin carboxyl carrier protein [Sphingomonadales bacterium]